FLRRRNSYVVWPPRSVSLRTRRSSSPRSTGTINSERVRPTASDGVYWKIDSAPLFQCMTEPSAAVMMAASGDSSASNATKSVLVGWCFFVRVSSRVEPKKGSTNQHIIVLRDDVRGDSLCPYCLDGVDAILRRSRKTGLLRYSMCAAKLDRAL